MTHITYKIVKHGEGWAYVVGDTFSETYPGHDAAMEAAKAAAFKHHQSGNTVGISYENQSGEWQEELADGHDRPDVSVVD